jgi:hypothetical protein
MNKPNSQCHLSAEALNKFYTRFEKCTSPPKLPKTTPDDTPTVTADQVTKALSGVNIRKSCGPDKIPNKLLKVASHSLGEPLANLFNICMAQGVFPDCWKRSTIIPIPKSAGADELAQFRPIALTSTISKVFEKLLLEHLKPHLTDSTQYAYQSHRSTEDALAYLMDVLTNHLDKNAKNHARCLFIDYSSAFNTISPTTLINQLLSTSLNPSLINLVYDFMTNRPQRVLSGQDLSPVLHTSTGTPQGCVISPLLFSIYVQHMPIPKYGNFHLIKYADDTVLIELLSKNDASFMSKAANELADWCNVNDLSLNVLKTKELIVCNLRDNPTHPKLTINGSDVEQVESFKYLGTILDKKLRFSENTSHTTKKARKRLYIMKKLYAMHVSKSLRIQCYRTFIECIFLYHLPTLYGHLSNISRMAINRVIDLAAYLGDCQFQHIDSIYRQAMKTRCLRLVCAQSDPNFILEQLPSGRYMTVKARINLRSNSFRACCARTLNNILF